MEFPWKGQNPDAKVRFISAQKFYCFFSGKNFACASIRHRQVETCCYLSNDYPALHPVQGENRQELWNALQDSGWNLLYEYGVSFPLQLRGNDDPDSNDFDEFIGMNCPPPNWNEGLDQELTKDLHLIQAFHNLFDHTDFAITDFIYCRDFYYEIKVEFRNEAQQSH